MEGPRSLRRLAELFVGTNITMLGGVLSKDDVTADYGTAASDKYNRYLIDPTSRWNDTSRFLRNR